MARQLLRRLKQEANETGALRTAKDKLEKQLEDLTLRLHLEKRLRVSVEEAKVAEITKHQKIIEALNLELEEAKSQTIIQGNKNARRQSDLELSMKEKYELQKQLQDMEDFKKENAMLRSSLEELEKRNLSLEAQLASAQKENSQTMQTLHEVEQKCQQLQNNLRRSISLTVLFGMWRTNCQIWRMKILYYAKRH